MVEKIGRPELLLLLYIVLTISSLIGQEPPAYFENSRDFVPCAARSALPKERES